MDNSEVTTDAMTVALGLPPTVPEKGLCLVVVSGAGKGAVFPLKTGATTLGRSAQHADFVVTGRGLSRSHACVVVTAEGSIEVEDLQSTNGLFVNGARVLRGPIRPGDTLTLGPDVNLRLEAPDQSIQSLLQEMHRGATRDALTGLLNRRCFVERLSEEAAMTNRHSVQTCLAMVDVDHFKSVNDTYGHPAGDAVLVEVARRLSQGLRTEDVVARFGGEEFVLLLRYTDLKGGVILLDRLREIVAGQPFQVPTPAGAQNIQVTFSAGITLLHKQASCDQLLERADVALYQAKRSGRNCVISSEAVP